MLNVLLTILLVVQRSANSFILHAAGKKVEYSSAVAILISELIKEVICWILAVYEADKESTNFQKNDYLSVPLFDIDADQTDKENNVATKFDQEILQDDRISRSQRIIYAISVVNEKTCNKQALFLMIPAGLYVIQNNLIMFSAPKMDPSVFQATWQVRLLPTAYLSGWLLRKNISIKQWVCLFGVLLGVIIIETANTWRIDSRFNADLRKNLDLNKLTISRNLLIGTLTLFIAAIISALASVMLEKVYSSKGKNLWIASFQLSFFSILPASILVAFECFNAIHWWLPFQSIFSSMWPWAVIFAQAFVGILVGLMTKHAGSVGNGLAGIGSIALTSFIALFLPENQIRTSIGKFMIGFGILVTIICTHLYSSYGCNNKWTNIQGEQEEEILEIQNEEQTNVSLESISIRSSLERY